MGEYTEESVEFMHRISLKNGLGNSTHLPVCHRLHPHNPTLETAREEIKMTLCRAAKHALARTGKMFSLSVSQNVGKQAAAARMQEGHAHALCLGLNLLFPHALFCERMSV